MSGADRVQDGSSVDFEADLSRAKPHSEDPVRIRARDLFLLLLCFFALQTSGHVYSPDGVVMGRVTESLAQGRGAKVDPFWIPGGFLYEGENGALYAKYAPGLSVVALPFYTAGAAMGEVAPSSAVDAFAGHRILWYSERNPHDAWRFFGMAWTNSAVVAAIAALLFLLALRLGWGMRAALLVTLTAALASPLWPYAKTFFSEPLGGLGLLAFVLFAETGIQEGRARLCFLAGLALGISVLARYADGLFLLLGPPVFLAIAVRRHPPGRKGGGAWPERARWIGAFAAGAALVLLAMMAYNLARFGAPWTTGYEKELALSSRGMGEALRGLLVSPGRGLLIYFPAAMLGLLCLPSVRKSAGAGISWTWPFWTAFTWTALLALVALYSQWHEWEGGWCWGPRFLVPIIPLLCLQLAPFYSRWSAGSQPRGYCWKRRALRWGGVTLLGLSCFIAFSGTIASYTDYHHALREQFGRESYYEVALWDWSAFPPLTWWGLAPKDFFVIRSLETPSLWWLAAFFGALAVFTLYRARLLVAQVLLKRMRRPQRRESSLWIAAGAIAAAACALGAWSSGPHVVLHFDFEEPIYGSGWMPSGEAFGEGPSQGAREGQPGIQGWFGRRLVNSHSMDPARATGTLRSPEFRITGERAAFGIGGARDFSRVYVRLLVDGEEKMRASGTGGVVLTEMAWDLTGLRGRSARLELVDQSREEGGYLLLDDFRIQAAD
ncbi:MAG: hypothetical protein V1774_07385 [Candidatus Eisenbacteria bacterium]